jgi:hypothetical protein
MVSGCASVYTLKDSIPLKNGFEVYHRRVCRLFSAGLCSGIITPDKVDCLAVFVIDFVFIQRFQLQSSIAG